MHGELAVYEVTKVVGLAAALYVPSYLFAPAFLWAFARE